MFENGASKTEYVQPEISRAIFRVIIARKARSEPRCSLYDFYSLLPLLWPELCPQIHVLKSQAAVLQNVTVFEDKILKDVITLK